VSQKLKLVHTAAIIDAHTRLQLIFCLAKLKQLTNCGEIPDKVYVTQEPVNGHRRNFSTIKAELLREGYEVWWGSRRALIKEIKKQPTKVCYVLSTSKIPVYAAVAVMRAKSRKVLFFFIEEGIGSYGGNLREFQSLWKNKFFFLAMRTPFVKIISDSLVSMKILKKDLLFRRDASINLELGNYFKKTISSLAYNAPSEIPDILSYDTLALVSRYEEVVDLLNRIPSKRILFKLHPNFGWLAETEKAEINYYNGNASAEEIVLMGRFKLVAGYNSSALLYVRATCRVDVVNCASHLPKDSNIRRLMQVHCASGF
jgi:hypothetical protein